MILGMEEIEEARREGLFASASELAQALHSLYMCPVSTTDTGPRVVILSSVRALPERRLAVGRRMEIDCVCNLLWSVLHVNGRRVGEVVCDCEPSDADYVICHDEAGYRVFRPVNTDLRLRGAA